MYALGIGGTLVEACPRCEGLLVLERLAYAYVNLACVCCGNRLDATILGNRANPPKTKPPTSQPRRYPLPIVS